MIRPIQLFTQSHNNRRGIEIWCLAFKFAGVLITVCSFIAAALGFRSPPKGPFMIGKLAGFHIFGESLLEITSRQVDTYPVKPR